MTYREMIDMLEQLPDYYLEDEIELVGTDGESHDLRVECKEVEPLTACVKLVLTEVDEEAS